MSRVVAHVVFVLTFAVAAVAGCTRLDSAEPVRLARAVGAAGAVPADTGRPLRVVTFNIYHGGPWSELTGNDHDLERRLWMAAAELAVLDPDIVGLQEASVGRRRGDVAERLARRLRMHHVGVTATEHALRFPLLGRALVSLVGFREGPAILSRFPIVESEVFHLPRCRRWYDPRMLLSATLRTPHGDLRVYSTHTTRDDCQLDRVRQIVTTRRNGLPSLLMADLNTTETMPALAAFRAAGFVDAFRALHSDADGATVWQRVDAPVATASRRVDYILMLPGEDVRGRVTRSRLVLNAPAVDADGRTLWLSDHYGVLADIAVAEDVAGR
jgi:endonuclease/exonuclease/phosphatase family metal-dependent hydrolase